MVPVEGAEPSFDRIHNRSKFNSVLLDSRPAPGWSATDIDYVRKCKDLFGSARNSCIKDLEPMRKQRRQARPQDLPPRMEIQAATLRFVSSMMPVARIALQLSMVRSEECDGRS